MSQREKTNIEVFVKTWRRLMERKSDPGDSFDAVINRVLDAVEAEREAAASEDEQQIEAAASEDDQQIVDDPDPVEEILDEWGPTYHGTPDETKRDAARQALELLQERGEAYRGLITAAQGEDLPDPDVVEDSFWQLYVRPAFKQGVELGYIEFDENTRPQKYRWTGR